MPQPLFLLAAPRSGSTLFGKALSRCPGIGVTNEAGWGTLLHQLSAYATTPAGEVAAIPHTGHEVAGLIPPDYIEAFRGAWREQVREMVVSFYRRLFPGELLWFGDKIANLQELESGYALFPEARSLLLVRDGRDSVVSMRNFKPDNLPAWHQLDFAGLCRRWGDFCARALELEGQFVVRYEDLVTDFEGTMRGVFAQLEVEPGKGYFEKIAGPAQELFAHHGTSANPAASLGRWRRELTAEEQEVARRQIGGVLAALGYPEE